MTQPFPGGGNPPPNPFSQPTSQPAAPAVPGFQPPTAGQAPPQAPPPPQTAPAAFQPPAVAQPPALSPAQWQPPQAQPRGFAPRAFDAARVLATQAAGNRYPYLLDGEYWLKILKTQVTTRNGAFVVEVEILQSSNPDRPAGQRASWVQGTQGRNPEAGFSTIHRFALSAVGCNEDAEATGKGHDLANLLNACAEPDLQVPNCPYPPNPLAGVIIGCRVTQVLTKQNTPFTRHDFFPYVAG